MIVKIFLPVLIIACVSSPSFASSEPDPTKNESKPTQHHNLRIEVKDGLISIEVKNAEISRVLEEIAKKAKIALTIDAGAKGKISIKMEDASIDEALKKICENRAIVYEYLPDTNAYRIISVGAYAGEKGAGEKQKSGERLKEEGSFEDFKKTQTGTKQPSERIYDSKGRPLYKPGELLVTFKEGISEAQIADLHQSLGSTVIGRMDRRRLQRIKLRDGLSEKEAMARYSASGIVELVEKHALRYPNIVPNDKYFGDQWGLTKIHASEAWKITQGSPEITIAVIDTGVDYFHPDLLDNIWVNRAELSGIEGVDDDGNGYIDDIRGWDFAGNDENDPGDADPMDVDSHGTHVAGIIAAKGNNGLGVAGVSWNMKIMALKVQADNGHIFKVWDIIRAIEYAIDHGVRIINCSFGGEANGKNEYNILEDLKEAGILAICAAGNESNNNDAIPHYPSSYDLDNIISVAASDQDDNLWGFSNYGLTSVDVMAPGDIIKSTIPAWSYTEASVKMEGDSDATEYTALGMEYAGTMGKNGITGLAYDCGKGYSDEFPSEVNGNIALIERGKRDEIDFYFSEKTTNAQSAGAAAVIIYNNEPGSFSGTLGTPGNWVPVVSISKEDGETLKTIGIPTVSLFNTLIDDPLFYGTKSGTSMAAPHVSGIAGLVLSKNPEFDYIKAKSAILDSVDKIPSVSDKMVSGGRVNALSALCKGVSSLLGDLTCDSNLGLDDAILALQIVSGLNPEICSECIPIIKDVNGDRRIGMEEALRIIQELGGVGR